MRLNLRSVCVCGVRGLYIKLPGLAWCGGGGDLSNFKGLAHGAIWRGVGLHVMPMGLNSVRQIPIIRPGGCFVCFFVFLGGVQFTILHVNNMHPSILS